MSNLVAVIKSLVGQVFVVSLDGLKRQVFEGERLFQGDQVVTASGGSATLELANGDVIDIAANGNWQTAAAQAPEQAQTTQAPASELEQAIAAGFDPTADLEPTAAGPGATGATGGAPGGGHSFVMLDETGEQLDPTVGFETEGLGFTSSSFVEEESLAPTEALEAANTAPVALADGFSVNEDGSISIDVLSNDTDLDGDTLTITAVDGQSIAEGDSVNVSNGSVTLTNGQLVFTPATNYNGPASFSYTVSDGVLTSTATVSGTVAAVNDAPTAVADSLTAVEDTEVTYSAADLLGNDSDIDGDTLTIASVTSGNGGTAVLNLDGSVTFTPNANFNGVADFSYTVTDGSLTSNTATVTVSVGAVNDAPAAVADSLTAIEDTEVTYSAADLLGNDSDIDGDTLTIASVTSGNGGTAVLNLDGSVTFTPNANFNGVADFSYTVTDGSLTSNTATVTVSVGAVNDAPAAVADSLTAVEDTEVTYSAADLLGNDSDIDGDTLTIASVTSGNGGTAVLNLDGSVTFTPNANFNGVADFSYTVTDGSLTSNTATVTVSVGAVNDAPAAVADSLTAIEDTEVTYSAADLLGNDSDIDGDTLTIASVTSGNGGTAVLNLDGSVTFTPNANFNGVADFSYTVTDGSLTSNTATVTVNVAAVNDAPAIADAVVSLDENVAAGTAVTNVDDSFTDSDLDRDGDAISYSITDGNGDGIFAIDAATGAISIATGKSLDYETASQHVLTVTASDGSLSDTAQVTVNVNNLNDNAPAIADAVVSLDENVVAGTAVTNVDDSFTDSDLDRDGDAISYSITDGNGDGIFAIDAATGAISIATGKSLDYETASQHVLTVTASDGSLSDTAQVTVNVNNLNDNAPAIADAVVSLDENVAAGTAVTNVDDSFTDSDLDRDGDAISYSITDGNGDGIFAIDAATGAISIATGKSLDYETASQHVLTVTASDGSLSDTAQVTVNVNNLNDNAPAIADAVVSLDENVAAGTAVTNVDDSFTDSDLDRDGDAISYSITDGNGDGIFAIDAATGAISIATGKSLDYETASQHVLTVTASDGSLSDTAQVTVNVNNLNDNAPAIADAIVSLDENVAAGTAVTNVDDSFTDSDLDRDGNTISYSITDGNGDGIFAIDAATGAISIATGKSLDYETASQHVLTVTASDGSLSDTAQVTVNVNNLNDNAPAIADAVVSLDENVAAGTAVTNVDDSFTDSDLDRDGDTISYSITDGNGDGIFAIDAATGAISIATGKSLDYETASQHVLTVTASDGSLSDTAQVTVNVNNLNDNAPAIADAVVSLDENVAAGTAVTNVDDSFTDSDLDRDGDAISYSITDGNGDGIFAIDAATGAISIATGKSLDYETASQHVLTVTASDGSLSDTAQVTVNVNNLNDNAPAIADAVVSLDENVAAGTAVTNVDDSFTDSDLDRDGDAISYSITDGNGDGIFAIDAATGAISIATGKSLDYETASQHVLTVTASDGSLSDTAQVTVNVNNLNDNAPAIADAIVSLDENVAAGTAVTNVDDSFTDSDLDRDGNTISYSITDGNGDGIFAIDAATGAISIATGKSLDYETASQHVLTVTASDGSLSDTAQVTVNVNNLNDNAPAIADAVVSLDENVAAGTAVTNVDDSFTDSDLDRDGDTISYSITDGNGDGIFAIDAATGAISIATGKSLDYETASQHVLTVTASDGSLSDTAQVTVNVNNLNDNAPAIADAVVSLDENVAAGTAVTNVDDSFTDSDLDRDGDTISYSITDGNGDGIFAIDAATGAISIATGKSLDYETASQHVLTVTASDGSLSDTAQVTVNVNNLNDNAPAIADAIVSLDENVAAGTAVTNVDDSFTDSDLDRDGNTISYSITDGNGDGIFAIDAATGAISIATGKSLDYETASQHVLTVTASDGSLSDTAQVTVNVNNLNDNAPAIADAIVSLDENVAAGTAVTNVDDSFTDSDLDRDGDTISYSITDGNGDGIFAIDAATGAISIATGKSLDYETASQHVLTVTASDGSLSDTAQVTVNVNNLNDNAPAIADAVVSLDENVVAGTAVTNVDDSFTDSDLDRDGDTISYSITDGNGDGIFAIDAATGAISIATGKSLDYETASQHVLTVTASDGSLSDTAQVTVNVNNLNDNAPAIADAVVSLDENVAAGTAVTNVDDSFTDSDLDRDGDTISYSITDGNGDGIFAIDAATGAISIATGKSLDYETASQHVLTVTASDGSLSDTAQVTVNVNNLNDNAPAIADAVVSLDENVVAGTAVTNVDDSFTDSDLDRDGDAISYSITDGNGDGIFAIDAATGAISIATGKSLDYETASQHVLTVTASDGSLSDTAQVTVNVNNLNDNAPAIADAVVSLDENVAAGTAVTNVDDSFTDSDLDRDGDAISYSITDGNGDGIFAIDAATGAISIATGKSLDYETASQHVLTVTASDGSLSDTAQVTVNVNNLNDNAPAIADAIVSLDENVAAGTAVTNVDDSFTDSDLDRDGNTISYSITDGNGDGIFAIDAATGAISIATGKSLDYETASQHVLTVTASDGSLSDTAQVTVNVNNLNDNAPAIADAVVSLDENVAAGTAVTNVDDSFTDSDLDRDGDTISYSITDGNGDGIFAIDAATGAISIATGKSLDYETASQHVLTVTASDGSLSDTAQVTVNVNNLNDNAPAIADAVVSLDENVAAGTAVTNVDDSFTDSDLDRDGDAISYSITDGNGDGIFAIDAATGAISIATGKSLDYETASQHVLTVTASDGSLSDTAQVTVNVNNLNDNAPAIADAVVSLDENVAAGTAVTNVDDSFTDSDLDRDGDAISYSITDGNGDGIFAIDAATGAISIATGKSLDYETASQHVLTVTASDGSLSDTAQVTVNVNNLNDNAPAIADAVVSLDENVAAGTAVTNVDDSFTDSDLDRDGDAISYSITDGNGDGIFAIDAATGAISIATGKSLDYETASQHVLTVTASDGSLSDTAQVTVNVNNLNDNAPAIADAVVSLDENVAAGTAVTNVDDSFTDSDLDRDGDAISYSITDGNGDGIFAIDAATGAISIATGKSLDYETASQHVLTVTASDGSLSDTAQVTVNVNNLNDNAPAIADAIVSLDENVAAGTAVTNVDDSFTDSDLDRDGNTISYSITDGNGDGIFAIDAATGAISIATGKSLDYETASQHVLTVTASDGSLSDTAQVTVNVNNLNDNAPAIADAVVSLDENVAAGTAVTNVDDSFTDSDLDRDGDTISYSITDGNGDGIFAIDAATGAISIATGKSLDYETASQHVLTVTASDGSLSDTAQVTVNVNNLNDNAPAIADAVVSLDENVAAGTAVTNVDDSFTDSDLDRDGDTISYSITDGNGDGIFAIDAATGAISIATGKSLDYETASQHVLTVTASDGSLSDTAQVTVNVNNLNAAPIAIDDINTVVELPANALYYSDNSGNIGILDPTTGTRTLIGNAGQTFTDIALDSSGNLFGATFGSLYSIDPTTGSATLIGSIGAGPINALVTSPDGRLFAANTSGGVYELSTATGTATSVGSFDHGSSGDLLFTDNSLYLSTSNGTIEKLDLASGTVTTVMTGLPSTLYNLAQTDVGTIYGSTSDGNLYLIDLVAGTATVTGVVSAGAEMWGFAAAPVDSSQVTISGDVTPGTPGQDYDPDGTAVTVIGVAAGTPATAPNSGVASVINGTYGTLTLDAGGSYTYTLDNTRAAVQDLDTGEVADEVFTYTITDADGATDTATLTIKVSGAGEVALLIASASANVSEEGLSGANADSAGTTDTTNNTSASGTLNISNANSDILSFSLTAPATALSSGGQPVQWSGSGTSQLTGTVNGVTALLISIDNVGNYNVDLLAPLDHAGSGEDLKSFGVTITVNDGSSTSSSILTVNIEDDSPLLATPMQAVLLDGIGASAIGDLHLSLGADQSGSSIQLSGLSVDGSGNILATTLSKAGVVISTSSYLTYQGAKLHYVTELDGSLKAVSSEGVDVFKVTASPVSGQYQITNYVSLDSSSSTFNSFKLSGGNSGVYDLGTGSNFTLLATATANGTADTVNTSNNSFGVGDGQAIDTGDVLTFTFSDKTTGAVTNMSAIALTTDKLDSNEQLTWTAYDSANQIVGSGTLNGVNGGKTSLTIDASKLNVGEYEFSSVNFGAASGTSYKLAITSITGQTATYDQQISLNVTAQDGDSDSSASQPLLITFDSDNSVQAGASGTALGGDSGNNNLIGGEGDDILLGASGNDTLTGGAGADTFVWRAGDTGNDVVKDFNKGEDVIDLSDLLSDVAEDNLVSFLRVDTATSTLQINTSGLLDGSGGNADITIKLENAGGFALSASDTINTLIAGGDLKVSHD